MFYSSLSVANRQMEMVSHCQPLDYQGKSMNSYYKWSNIIYSTFVHTISNFICEYFTHGLIKPFLMIQWCDDHWCSDLYSMETTQI